jgi:hypothetical protein
MKKIARTVNTGFLAAMCLAAVFSFAPLAAQAANKCACNGTVGAVDCTTASDCGGACSSIPGATATCVGATGGDAGGGSGTKTEGLENPLGAICGSGKNAITGQQCARLIIGNVIRAALGVSGAIAFLMMTWGGFLWLTSMGNSERVEKGKNTLIWATLGLALIFGAYGLTSYIIKAIATGGK